MHTQSNAVLDADTLAHAVLELCEREPRFDPIVLQHGVPSLRQSIGGLEGLLQIVTEQFLSLAAAGAIWNRLVVKLQPFTAETILACPASELLGLGLSNAKVRSFHGIVGLVQSGAFKADQLPLMSDAEAQKLLESLPGVGPWTADIYLLSVLLRADVWPWGDVALQVATQDLFNLASRPGKPEMMAIGENFRPHRAVAARLLWSHYRGLKRLKQA